MDTAAIALATFFATIGPLDIAAIFAALTASATPSHRRSMAVRGTLIGGGILLLFALTGEVLLTSFGISLAALRTAGGILLLLIGIDMVWVRLFWNDALPRRIHGLERESTVVGYALTSPTLRPLLPIP